MTIKRKKTRLASANYVGHQAYFVTICCDSRRPYLAEVTTAERAIMLLKTCAASQKFLLHAYCAMPDHLHLLVEGNTPTADLVNLIRVFKLRTSFEFRKSRNRRLWEMDFYDHILRRADSLENVASYIWWNPVRKGLCAAPEEFPYSGSETIRWMQRSGMAPSWVPPWKAKEGT